MKTLLTLTLLASLALPAFTAGAAETKHGEFRGAVATTYPDWFKESFLDFHEDIAEAAEEGRRVAVMFHQDGCPYCNVLVEKNLATREIETFIRRHFDVIALNLWGDREVVSVAGDTFTEKELGAALGVQYTPTMLFFTEDAKVALRLDGYVPPERFALALRYVAERREGTEAFHAFVAREAGDRPAASGTLREQPWLLAETDLTRRPGAGDKPLAVLFEQTECPDCDRLHTQVFNADSARAQLARFDVVRYDRWGRDAIVTPAGTTTTARAWGDTLGVSYAPSIVLFDAGGREVIRMDSQLRRFHVESILDYVASGAWREEPSFQRFISARAEALRERGIDVDLWQ